MFKKIIKKNVYWNYVIVYHFSILPPSKNLFDFFPSVQTLLDRVTQYLCWWEMPGHEGYKNTHSNLVFHMRNYLHVAYQQCKEDQTQKTNKTRKERLNNVSAGSNTLCIWTANEEIEGSIKHKSKWNTKGNTLIANISHTFQVRII